jgi:PBSX family phage terminase large subunit
MPENVNTVIELHPEQWKAYHFVKPYGLVLTGTKGGKTYLSSVWCNKKIGEYPLGNGLIAAPTVKILQQSTLDTFFKLFPEWQKYFKKQESVIELPSGGKVYVRSTDDPLALEGFNLDWAWLDEAGMMSRNTWAIIKNKVAISRGQILMSTNAYYLNWLYKELYLPVMEGKEHDVEVFNWKSVDNPYFPKEFALKEKERLLPAEYARRYEGRFVRMEGLVWDVKDSNVLEMTPDLKEYLDYPERVVAGIDWGFTNPAGIVVAKVKDNKYYIIDEWKAAKMPTSAIIGKCLEFSKKYLVQCWYPDPAEPDRVEECRKAGMAIGDVNKDITLGVGKVQELLTSHRLFILSECKDLLDEIDQYRYENPRKEDRDRKEQPLAVNNHLCDSLRYTIIGNELGQNFTYQEEKYEKQRIMENRIQRREFELL